MSNFEKAELLFSFDVSAISYVHGWSIDAGKVDTVECVLRGNSHLLDGVYVEVKTVVINGVTYRGGSFWGELRGGAWRCHAARLSSPVGTYADATRSATLRFGKLIVSILAALPQLDGLTDALVSAARWEAANILTRSKNDLLEVEKAQAALDQRLLEARTRIALVQDVITELEDGITGDHHQHLLAYLEAGHSFTDAIAAARVMA